MSEARTLDVTKRKGRHWPDRNGIGKGIRWIREHVNYSGDECLPWPLHRRRGYGIFYHFSIRYQAHRYMCELVNGPQPSPSHETAHSCGNRECVNPKHLSWKTRSENQLDRRIHGTKSRPNWWKGDGAGSKLTGEQVAEIRALKGIKTQDELAAAFGCTHSNISHIQRGSTWRGRNG